MSARYDRLWNLLFDRKITKAHLSEISGVSEQTLYRMGRNENISIDTLEKLCRALECEIYDILEFVDDESALQ